MNWHVYVRSQFREITGDPARDEDIVEELAQHLAERYEDLRRTGSTHVDALTRATAELSDRDGLARAIAAADRPRPSQPLPSAATSHLLADLWRDVRYACRLLAKTPAFSVPAILTLTLGIGMTTAIFTVVDAVLLRPVPFPGHERLLMVWETDRQTSTTHEPSSFPDFVDFQRGSRTIDSFGAFVAGDANLTPAAGEPIRVAVVFASSGFLPLVGAKPLTGRLFTSEEDRRRGPDVIVISDRLWERLFQRDPAVVGRALQIDGRSRTVIGVLPTDADFGLLQMLSAADYSRGFADRDARTRVDLWAPLQADEESMPRRTHPLLLVGRLAPGATVGAAQEELTTIAADLEKTYPEDNEARGVFVERLSEVIFGPVERAMLVLLAAVATVLMISCVNVANLLMARGAARLREVAVRSVLGADLPRLARQFVVENTVLTLLSAVLGAALVFFALRVLVAMAPADIPRLASARLDVRVLGVAFALAVAVGLTFGLLPVAQARRVDLLALLNAGDPRAATVGLARGRLRSILVVAEMALAAMLAIGAGLLIKSFWQIRQVDPGFAVAGVLKAEFQLPPSRYPVDFRRPDFSAIRRFNDTLLARVAALPGVESAALAVNHPLDAGFTSSFGIVGREAESATFPEISIRRVTHDYFTTLRVPLVRGRLLEEADGVSPQSVVLINDVAAKQFFPGQDPIGQQLVFYGTIVGVVGSERIFGVAKSPPIALYVPLARLPSVNGAEALLVRTSGDPSGLASAVQSAIREADPGLAVFGVEPLAAALSASVADARFVTLLLSLFAGLALLLAAIGIHGVLSYDIAQRVREIGIRMALGAPPNKLATFVVLHGATLSAIGLAIGVALGGLFGRVLASLLFGVSAHDLAVFGSVVAVLGGVALLATWLPARRAVKVNPLIAMRDY
jgi:putative ABC transport system permease protein